jgi:hypothetical protein
MATIEESIDIGCPTSVTADDLKDYFFRHAIGEFRDTHMGHAWHPGGDVILDGAFAFASTDDGASTLTVTVTYDVLELAADGGDVTSLRTIIRAHLERVRAYCLMRRAAA